VPSKSNTTEPIGTVKRGTPPRKIIHILNTVICTAMNKQTNYLREMSDSSMRKEPKKRFELQVSSLIEHWSATEWPLCQQSHIHSCSQRMSFKVVLLLPIYESAKSIL
jgi:hypothetical protein